MSEVGQPQEAASVRRCHSGVVSQRHCCSSHYQADGHLLQSDSAKPAVIFS